MHLPTIQRTTVVEISLIQSRWFHTNEHSMPVLQPPSPFLPHIEGNHKRQFDWVTFSPMRGSTSLMTGLVFLAKARILARSVRILTGTSLAVATIAQFQKAASHMSPFSIPKRLFEFRKHHPYTGNLNSGTSGDNKNVFLHCQKRHLYTENLSSETSGDSTNAILHCGDVLGTVGWYSIVLITTQCTVHGTTLHSEAVAG